MRRKHTLDAAGAIGAVALLAGPAAGSASAAEEAPATVTVVHGVPGVTVDGYADDKKVISDLTFKEVSDALRVPGGTYDLEVREAGDPASAEPILSSTEEVPAGANVTVVAALGTDGKPALRPYVNDTGALPAGSGRLIVRHRCRRRSTCTRARTRPSAHSPTARSRRSPSRPARCRPR